MPEILAVAAAVALGCLVSYAFADLPRNGPKWARALLVLGAGALTGIAVTSVLFFATRLLIPSPAGISALGEAALAAACLLHLRRRSAASDGGGDAGPTLFALPLAAVLLAALALATSVIARAWEANPQGNWDAWAIWNMRARFLAAGGGVFQRAWSAQLAGSHPEYPLLTSAFIARCWVFARAQSAAAPMALSYVFFAAIAALAAGAFAMLRSRTLGLLLALTIVASPVFLLEVPAQYADVALACYIPAALLMALLDRPVLAGVFAGCAAWTKDEGLFFVAAFLAAMLVFRRRQALRALIGVAPAAVVVGVFKVLLATGTQSLYAKSLPTAAARVATLDRYDLIGGAFVSQLARMGAGWYHPLLPVLVLYIALGFDRERRRDVFFCLSVCCAMLAGYFAMYLITMADLPWQLNTSVNRLFVQVWPALLLAAFLGVRAPEAAAVAVAVKPGKAARKGRAKG